MTFMKTSFRSLIPGMAPLLLVLWSADSSAIRYKVVDLGLLSGRSESTAEAINEAELVVGTSGNDSLNDRAVRFRQEPVRDVSSDVHSRAHAINSQYWLGGTRAASYNGSRPRMIPFLSSLDGPPFDLTPPHPYALGSVNGLNDWGWAVGVIQEDSGFTEQHSFLYLWGEFRLLHYALGGGSRGSSIAWDINNRGVAVGEINTGSSYRAFMVSTTDWIFAGIPRSIPIEPLPGSIHSRARAINDDNHIAGSVEFETGEQVSVLARFPDYRMRELPRLSTASVGSSEARAINANNWVVGDARLSWETEERHAFLFVPDPTDPDPRSFSMPGTTYDLNDLILPGDQVFWKITRANGINSGRKIVGQGEYRETWASRPVKKAVMLIPVRE